ncbi:MAG: restriction endonuclease subunit S [Dechloromonas sp.]|nr:restriction endonuclease subunit S [Dechloromonas sp.]
MKGWRDIKLKDVSEYVTVGYVGSMADQYVESGVPFLRSLNIQPFQLNYNDLKYIPDSFHDSIKKSQLRPGDVAIVRTGYPGTACVIPRELPDANCSDLVILRPGPELNPHFVAAVFNSSFGRSLVGGNLVGAAQQHFNVTVAKELKLLLPQRAEQDKIAAVLVGLNDLIANNQRRIALLESMAEEIYREWFVRMRFPGAPYGLSRNNPPADWALVELPRLASITYGFPFVGERFTDTAIGKKIIRIRDVLTGDSSTYTDEVADEKYVVRAGDLLIGMDGEFHMNHWIAEDAYLVQRTCRVKPNQERLRAYLALALKAPISHYQQIIVGATVGHLGAKHLNAIKLLVPSEDLNQCLDTLNRLLDQRILLSKQNLRLAKTRNTLLPRLISGKLRVDQLDIQYPLGMLAEMG